MCDATKAAWQPSTVYNVYQNRSYKPFLKWAGGKTQLIPELIKYIPPSFNRYIEAFVGGGALYFHLSHRRSIISDLNEDLISTYIAVRDKADEVVGLLEKYKNTEKFFYKVRSWNPIDLDEVSRAARLIYLNKTCFNGLYRVNKKGEFNTPYNKREGAPFLNKTDIYAASDCLKSTKIICGDYKEVLVKNAKKGDFIFLDPPYHPISEFSDFKRYTKAQFYDQDQVDLFSTFEYLVDKGCFVILTNSDHPFIRGLYKSFEIKTIETKRMISCNSETRSSKDLIILGGI
jgi:DNA adenine methylase